MAGLFIVVILVLMKLEYNLLKMFRIKFTFLLAETIIHRMQFWFHFCILDTWNSLVSCISSYNKCSPLIRVLSSILMR